jgi:hypothetical protein
MRIARTVKQQSTGDILTAGWYAVSPSGDLLSVAAHIPEDGLKPGWRWATQAEVTEAARAAADDKAAQALKQKRAAAH